MHTDNPFDGCNPAARPPRVLHLIHWLNLGGIESWLLAALQHMPRDRFAMDVCCKGPHLGELAPQARLAGAQLIRCPLGPTVVPFVRRLARILGRGKYDLLHVHVDAHAGPAVWAARSASVPSIVSFHNTNHPAETRLTRQPVVRSLRTFYAHRSMRYAIRNATRTTGVSQGVATAVTRLASSAVDCCRVFYLGCPRPDSISSTRRAEYRAELGADAATNLIVHMGSFTERKNHAGILRVFSRLLETAPNSVLALVGDGPLRANIETIVRDTGIAPRVRFLGTRRDATTIMQACDVLLFPSHHEGLSIVLMEAAAAGVPVVASDIPGNREATGDGTSARLHATPDIAGMAASLKDLLANDTSRRELTSRGRTIYQQTFSIEASVKRLEQLYDEVLNESLSHTTDKQLAA
jgi:glycosyltransferase EpsF